MSKILLRENENPITQAIAARKSNVSTSLISLWINRKRLDAIHIFGKNFVYLSDVIKVRDNPRKGGRPKKDDPIK